MRYILAVRDFLRKLKADHISAYAAQTAYFMILSFIPFSLMLLTLIKFTPITKSDLYITAVELLPPSIDPVVIAVVDEVYNKSGAVLSMTALTAAWSAGKGVMAIMRALNTIHGIEDRKGYILTRLQAAFYTILFVVAIVLSLLIVAFGNRILHFIEVKFPLFTGITDLLVNTKNFAVLGILTLVFWVMFKFIPWEKTKKTRQFPGAVFTAVAWTVFSYGFSLYLDLSSGFGNMYGSLTTIVLVMLWLYGCMYIMLVGAEINTCYPVLFRGLGFHRKYRIKEYRNKS